MKKHLFIISALMLSSVILITGSTTNQKEKMNITKTTISQTERNYILKDYNGRIALFFENDEKPLKIYNIFTDSLPEYDANSLKNGITVNKNELNDVLSDYIS